MYVALLVTNTFCLGNEMTVGPNTYEFYPPASRPSLHDVSCSEPGASNALELYRVRLLRTGAHIDVVRVST